MTPWFRLAALRWRLSNGWLRLRGKSRTRDMSSLVGFYGTMWGQAAQTLAASLTEMDTGFWRIHQGSRSTLINNYVVQIDDPVTLNLAGNKVLCHRMLSEAGLPVPEHLAYVLDDFDKVPLFMARQPGSWFVVKPAAGTSGARGVTTHVATVKECRNASVLASLYGSQILIERWVPGESYRLLFLDGELIHASRRQGWRVTGNGRATIAELIAADARSAPTGLPSQSQQEIALTLKAQGLHLASVPGAGKSVVVHSTRKALAGTVEMRTVFDEQATDEIGAGLREEAARAVRAIGSDFAGVDVITTDPALPLEVAGGVINEINTTPGLHHHYGLRGSHHGAAPAVRVLARLLGNRIQPEAMLAGAAAETLTHARQAPAQPIQPRRPE